MGQVAVSGYGFTSKMITVRIPLTILKDRFCALLVPYQHLLQQVIGTKGVLYTYSITVHPIEVSGFG